MKDYKERYKRLSESEWFKKHYNGKSLGENITISDDMDITYNDNGNEEELVNGAVVTLTDNNNNPTVGRYNIEDWVTNTTEYIKVRLIPKNLRIDDKGEFIIDIHRFDTDEKLGEMKMNKKDAFDFVTDILNYVKTLYTQLHNQST